MKIFNFNYSNSLSHSIKSPLHSIIPALLFTFAIVNSMQATIATATIFFTLPIIRFLIILPLFLYVYFLNKPLLFVFHIT